METQESNLKRRRGFALLSPERRQEIASQGGQAAHACGRAHRFTAEEARAAGRRGFCSPVRPFHRSIACLCALHFCKPSIGTPFRRRFSGKLDASRTYRCRA